MLAYIIALLLAGTNQFAIVVVVALPLALNQFAISSSFRLATA